VPDEAAHHGLIYKTLDSAIDNHSYCHKVLYLKER
jgi:hypothetical protein